VETIQGFVDNYFRHSNHTHDSEPSAVGTTIALEDMTNAMDIDISSSEDVPAFSLSINSSGSLAVLGLPITSVVERNSLRADPCKSHGINAQAYLCSSKAISPCLIRQTLA
jgi:hypothetical protein